jgi:predicted ATP-grasp superfamily ATP-dependent carboligase
MSRLVLLLPNDGCLTIARAVGRRGVEVQALTTDEYAYVLRSRYVSGGRVMPDIRRHPEAWVTQLNASAPAVLISGSDAATEWLVAHRKELDPGLISFETADGLHTELMDKQRLYEIAAAAGVRAPWMRHAGTRSELDEMLPGMTYPCVLKPTMGHVAKDLTGVGTLRMDSRADVLEHAGRLLDLGVPVLLTELVPGPETLLEGAVAIRDADGSYPLEYGRRKIRQWPLDYGVGCLMEAADVSETREMNRKLLDITGYVGVAACETKRHAQTGDLYLIEINVRVPGAFGLAQACGVDGPWRLYATLAGLPLGPQPEQIDGRKMMLPQKEAAALAKRLRARDVTPWQVLKSWRGTRDLGAFALDDPMPLLSLVLRLARKRYTAATARPLTLV